MEYKGKDSDYAVFVCVNIRCYFCVLHNIPSTDQEVVLGKLENWFTLYVGLSSAVLNIKCIPRQSVSLMHKVFLHLRQKQ